MAAEAIASRLTPTGFTSTAIIWTTPIPVGASLPWEQSLLWEQSVLAMLLAFSF